MFILSPILGVIGIVGALGFVFTQPSGSFRGFFDLTSLVFLVVVPPSVMLLSHTLKDFSVGIQTVISSMTGSTMRHGEEIIAILTRASAMVRSDGIGSLVGLRNHIRYPFLRDSISMIVNDFSAEEIRHNLTNKINAKQSRMSLASHLFENMAAVSPGVGLMGTLIGLIQMMSNLSDPSRIGGGMALAMITTLYGIFLGTLLYAPCSEKISLESEKCLEIDLMVLEGVMSLKNKKSSVHMKDIMSTYAGKHNQPGGATPPKGARR